MPPLPEAEPPSDILFAGLEGKKLWDAMNGKTVEGFDASLIDALRAHYEPILREHITLAFKDGLEDVDGSESRVPSSERRVTTLRGHIQSWLPPQHLGGIYRAALEFAGSYKKNPQSQVFERLKQTVDSVTGMLYQRANIPLEVPFSEFLFDLAKEDEVPEEEKPQTTLFWHSPMSPPKPIHWMLTPWPACKQNNSPKGLSKCSNTKTCSGKKLPLTPSPKSPQRRKKCSKLNLPDRIAMNRVFDLKFGYTPPILFV
jgi:hypothetical protein